MTALSSGPDGKIQLSLLTCYDVEDPLLIALSPEVLQRLVKLEINTVAMKVQKSGTAYVYNVKNLLAAYEAAKLEGVTKLWLTAQQNTMIAVLKNGLR